MWGRHIRGGQCLARDHVATHEVPGLHGMDGALRGTSTARHRPDLFQVRPSAPAPPGKYTQLIIQITTTGREHARVTEIIDQVRSYDLSMNYEIWVVTEPGFRARYPRADRVLVVPPEFAANSRMKARALEYSRRFREQMGLERGDVKILFNDDDVTLTRGYIERAFMADYDICEGIVAPRTHYGVRPFGHFAASHADDIRTQACLVYCSVFQGIFGALARPWRRSHRYGGG